LNYSHGDQRQDILHGVWNNSILPNRSIYIRRGLLRFESSCMAILSLCHDITRIPDRDNHLLVFSWSIELLIFGERLLVRIPSKITLRLGTTPTRTLPSRPIASAWWVQSGSTLKTVPVGTRPSGDLKCPMHRHPVTELFGI
jgi:hypothetical protein